MIKVSLSSCEKFTAITIIKSTIQMIIIRDKVMKSVLGRKKCTCVLDPLTPIDLVREKSKFKKIAAKNKSKAQNISESLITIANPKSLNANIFFENALFLPRNIILA